MFKISRVDSVRDIESLQFSRYLELTVLEISRVYSV